MKYFAYLLGIFSLLLALPSCAAPDIRLYALDCGHMRIADMSGFSDSGAYPHKPVNFIAPCFLIKHDSNWLLWDLGLGEQAKKLDAPRKNVTFTTPVTLTAQLQQLNLKPDDIQFVGISHAHFDHTGNMTLFPKATWLIQEAEYKYMQQSPLPASVTEDTFLFLKPVSKNLLKGDEDLFKDGFVKILSTPGHTWGHQSLQLALPHHGTVILSGDLYHMRQSYLTHQVPSFNTSRPETLASMKRMDDILKTTHGKLIVEHDETDFASLPKFPKYLD